MIEFPKSWVGSGGSPALGHRNQGFRMLPETNVPGPSLEHQDCLARLTILVSPCIN